MELNRSVIYKCNDELAVQKLFQFCVSSRNYKLRCASGVPGRVWDTNKPEWLTVFGLEDRSTFLRADLAQEIGVCNCLAVPVLVCGEVLGVIAFYSTTERSFDSNIYEKAKGVANILSIALTVQSV